MGDKKMNRQLGLPTYCPSWCSDGLSGHRQDLKEGATVEHAGQHRSTDLSDSPGTLVHPAHGRISREGRRLDRAADSGDKAGAHTFLWLELRITGGHHVALNLTTGEARTPAAQLVALADAEDADPG